LTQVFMKSPITIENVATVYTMKSILRHNGLQVHTVKFIRESVSKIVEIG